MRSPDTFSSSRKNFQFVAIGGTADDMVKRIVQQYPEVCPCLACPCPACPFFRVLSFVPCVCSFSSFGQVYLIEGWKTEDGAQEGGSKGGRGRGRNAVSVRKTSSAELGGVRLNNSMMADHSVDAYESAIAAAAQRYRKRG